MVFTERYHLFDGVTHQVTAEKFVRFYGFALKEKLLDLGQYLGSTLDYLGIWTT